MGLILNYVVGLSCQICPGLNANEIQILYADKHHKVFSLVKSHKTLTILSNKE